MSGSIVVRDSVAFNGIRFEGASVDLIEYLSILRALMPCRVVQSQILFCENRWLKLLGAKKRRSEPARADDQLLGKKFCRAIDHLLASSTGAHRRHLAEEAKSALRPHFSIDLSIDRSLERPLRAFVPSHFLLKDRLGLNCEFRTSSLG